MINLHQTGNMSSAAAIGLCLVMIAASCSVASAAVSKAYTNLELEAEATKYTVKTLLEGSVPPAEQTIAKALTLCQSQYRNMQCAWLTLDPLDEKRVTGVACMNELLHQCARNRRSCADCRSCSNATSSAWGPEAVGVNRTCYCGCPAYPKEVYPCHQACDGKQQCSNGKDEVQCPGFTADQWYQVLGPLVRWAIGLAFWAAVACAVILVYYRLRARGQCGSAPRPQQLQQQQLQQQQAASAVPLMAQPQQQQQQQSDPAQQDAQA